MYIQDQNGPPIHYNYIGKIEFNSEIILNIFLDAFMNLNVHCLQILKEIQADWDDNKNEQHSVPQKSGWNKKEILPIWQQIHIADFIKCNNLW